jgi:histidyl-tRNA synthetase
MPLFRAPRGTRDLLPAERAAFARLERIARELGGRYGYREMETPLFEVTAVFERGIGEVTDVVEKELFRLAPRSEEKESWALRPEATAGIVRAYLQHGMHTWPSPVKLALTGPMFRYDRPQAGRFRQFWQWDVEAIGDAGPAVDAELVELGARFYREAGLSDVQIHLNSIGDTTCRPAYVAALRAHYEAAADRLPALERRRLDVNPLRLLDSKDPAMAALNANAPRITDHLCGPCAEHFAAVRTHLDAVGIAYRIEPALVRVLPPGRRGPAVGPGWGRALRRPRRAPRGPAHAGHRVRARAGSGRSGPRDLRRRRGARTGPPRGGRRGGSGGHRGTAAGGDDAPG